mmetsp:Transcript_20376/g.43130  ORF Transcript_20376/g.43130 Transcript_20376/m.43130 type:complete len:140 (-) Transcript_20376:170-589(-)
MLSWWIAPQPWLSPIHERKRNESNRIESNQTTNETIKRNNQRTKRNTIHTDTCYQDGCDDDDDHDGDDDSASLFLQQQKSVCLIFYYNFQTLHTVVLSLDHNVGIMSRYLRAPLASGCRLENKPTCGMHVVITFVVYAH